MWSVCEELVEWVLCTGTDATASGFKAREKAHLLESINHRWCEDPLCVDQTNPTIIVANLENGTECQMSVGEAVREVGAQMCTWAAPAYMPADVPLILQFVPTGAAFDMVTVHIRNRSVEDGAASVYSQEEERAMGEQAKVQHPLYSPNETNTRSTLTNGDCGPLQSYRSTSYIRRALYRPHVRCALVELPSVYGE